MKRSSWAVLQRVASTANFVPANANDLIPTSTSKPYLTPKREFCDRSHVNGVVKRLPHSSRKKHARNAILPVSFPERRNSKIRHVILSPPHSSVSSPRAWLTPPYPCRKLRNTKGCYGRTRHQYEHLTRLTEADKHNFRRFELPGESICKGKFFVKRASRSGFERVYKQ
ncbi:hypothetical protein OG21DRAFT_330342 [Imleria badia]|nr:hypothetical protein OG21DRAFT_330342 [Imleria badia]